MNMNPLTWLLIVAPTAVIGVLLFIWIDGRNAATADLERDKINLEKQEFNRDFAAAWNGEKLQAPEAGDMAKLRTRIDKKEAAAAIEAAKRCRELAKLANHLNQTLEGQGGKAEQANNPDCQEK